MFAKWPPYTAQCICNETLFRCMECCRKYCHGKSGIMSVTLKPDTLKIWEDVTNIPYPEKTGDQDKHKGEGKGQTIDDVKDQENTLKKLILCIDTLDPVKPPETVIIKWVWPRNAIITHCRQTHGTVRRMLTTTWYQIDNKSKATHWDDWQTRMDTNYCITKQWPNTKNPQTMGAIFNASDQLVCGSINVDLAIELGSESMNKFEKLLLEGIENCYNTGWRQKVS